MKGTLNPEGKVCVKLRRSWSKNFKKKVEPQLQIRENLGCGLPEVTGGGSSKNSGHLTDDEENPERSLSVRGCKRSQAWALTTNCRAQIQSADKGSVKIKM